jgi:hypothetical protein
MNEKRTDARQRYADHRLALAEEYGVVGHPKLNLLYDKAYSLGHSSGYNEVGIYFGELVDLIR